MQYSNNITNMMYIGNVQLKLKIKDKIINISNHNTGLPGLKRAFCNFITGNIHNSDLPQFMDLRIYTQNNGYSPKNTLLINKLPVTGKSWEESKFVYSNQTQENTYVAKLTAVLSSNSLVRKISSTEEGPFRLYLISGTDGIINDVQSGYFDLAYLPISATDLNSNGSLGIYPIST